MRNGLLACRPLPTAFSLLSFSRGQSRTRDNERSLSGSSDLEAFAFSSLACVGEIIRRADTAYGSVYNWMLPGHCDASQSLGQQPATEDGCERRSPIMVCGKAKPAKANVRMRLGGHGRARLTIELEFHCGLRLLHATDIMLPRSAAAADAAADEG